MIRVGVVGAAGRMGRTVIEAVEAAPDLSITALIDPKVEEVAAAPSALRAHSLAELEDGACDVLVDFTAPDVVNAHLVEVVERGFDVVVGTTGLSDAVVEALHDACATGGNAFIAPNFALGAVLLMEFAQRAAGYFDAVEIIELHHDKKVDAPSGTAMATARHIAEGRQGAGRTPAVDPTTTTTLEGARGGRGSAEVPIHSIRLPGLVAHEEVIFGNPGETLTIRHDSIDRVSFMPGVLLAVRSVQARPGVTVGLEHLIRS
jgi:4-hydroxy-tetrahydrodipicolinate reductase